MIRKILQYALAVLAALLVWALFPNQWLLGMGVDAAWVGLAKIIASIAAAWLVVTRRTVPDSGR